jgi:hypothetical protein
VAAASRDAWFLCIEPRMAMNPRPPAIIRKHSICPIEKLSGVVKRWIEASGSPSLMI